MIAFLKTDALPRPTRVTTPPAAEEKTFGVLTPNFEEGSFLLKSKDGTFYRVGWKKDDNDRRRAVPPGEYTLTSYTLVRRDDAGKEWFLSATGRAIRKLSVRAGAEQKVALEEFAHVQCRAVAQQDGVQVQGVVQGEHHSGASLYRGGKRITLGYRLTDAQGKERAAGKLEYG